MVGFFYLLRMVYRYIYIDIFLTYFKFIFLYVKILSNKNKVGALDGYEQANA